MDVFKSESSAADSQVFKSLHNNQTLPVDRYGEYFQKARKR
jgi:hypothetical protein